MTRWLCIWLFFCDDDDGDDDDDDDDNDDDTEVMFIWSAERPGHEDTCLITRVLVLKVRQSDLFPFLSFFFFFKTMEAAAFQFDVLIPLSTNKV